MAHEIESEARAFGGTQRLVRHTSSATGTEMRFAVFTPDGDGPFPTLVWLSGLTCTWENAATKSGAQRFAAQCGLAMVFPDTSPRGEGVADDEAYDLGQGAGFYLDAQREPWRPHFRMEEYIASELPGVLKAVGGVDASRLGLTGHSMGGHGALCLALKHPETFRSLSAFSPICSAPNVPWGEKALSAYLGDDRGAWREHDAAALVSERGWSGGILVDVGGADAFLEKQLQPQRLTEAAEASNTPLELHVREGYDHSYWFVASFVEDHVRWHADRL